MIQEVRDVELKGAMLDQGSSLNIISLPVLDAMGVPQENITRQPIAVSGFRGGCTYTMGFVSLDLIVEAIRAAHQIYIIDAQTPTTCCLDDSRFIITKPFSLGTTTVEAI